MPLHGKDNPGALALAQLFSTCVRTLPQAIEPVVPLYWIFCLAGIAFAAGLIQDIYQQRIAYLLRRDNDFVD